MLKTKTKHSQEQSRRGFSRYLRCVQQRLPSLLDSSTAGDSHHQLDLIEKFLLRLGSAGRLRSASPSSSKSPIKKLVGRDRVASLAARLGEFLDRYEATAAHHHHHQSNTQQVGADCNGQQELKVVDSQVFDDFLLSARYVRLPIIIIIFFLTHVFHTSAFFVVVAVKRSWRKCCASTRRRRPVRISCPVDATVIREAAAAAVIGRQALPLSSRATWACCERPVSLPPPPPLLHRR